MKKILVILTVICFTCCGCIPLLIGTAVYGVTKSSQNKTAQRKAYDEYVFKIQEINITREEKGMELEELLSFPEWKETIK